MLLSPFLGISQNNKLLDSLKLATQSSNDSLVMDAYNKLRRATYYNDADASKGYTKKYLEYALKRNSNLGTV